LTREIRLRNICVAAHSIHSANIELIVSCISWPSALMATASPRRRDRAESDETDAANILKDNLPAYGNFKQRPLVPAVEEEHS
jgi:hypothetical protein